MNKKIMEENLLPALAQTFEELAFIDIQECADAEQADAGEGDKLSAQLSYDCSGATGTLSISLPVLLIGAVLENLTDIASEEQTMTMRLDGLYELCNTALGQLLRHCDSDVSFCLGLPKEIPHLSQGAAREFIADSEQVFRVQLQ